MSNKQPWVSPVGYDQNMERILEAFAHRPFPLTWGVLLRNREPRPKSAPGDNDLFLWFSNKAQLCDFLRRDVALAFRFEWDLEEFRALESALERLAIGRVDTKRSLEQHRGDINDLLQRYGELLWIGQAIEMLESSAMGVELRMAYQQGFGHRVAHGLRGVWSKERIR